MADRNDFHTPLHLDGKDTRGHVEPKNYGRESRMDPDHDVTQTEEYHKDGLPKSVRYTVHRPHKTPKGEEPSVSRPRDLKEREEKGSQAADAIQQSGRPEQANYGF